MERPAARWCQLPPGYIEQVPPSYYSDDVPAEGGITWQPDVYPYARDLARLGGVTTIVDVGCGHADKLAALHVQHPDWELVGVDWDTNFAYCATTYRWGAWVALDLEDPPDLLRDHLDGAVVICADVLEHLIDPRPLLHCFARSSAVAVLLSTPDRAVLYPPDHRGPPANPCHVREWSASDFVALLETEGLQVVAVMPTRSNDHEPDLATTLVVARP